MADKIAEHVYMAKLGEQTERFEDMVKHMKEVISLNIDLKRELKDEERNLLSIAYKNTVGQRRTAWRAITAYEMKEKTKGSHYMEVIKYYKAKIEAELDQICRDVLKIISDNLLTGDNTQESKVFFLKMKGDYHRYLAEFQQGEGHQKAALDTEEAYKDAIEQAKELKATHPIRLGLNLNFSVFYYEVLNDIKQACAVGKKAFDEAINELENLEDEQYKDSTTIMQLIRDNLTSWTQEMNQEENNNEK